MKKIERIKKRIPGKVFSLSAALLACVLILWAEAEAAEQCKPLLMEGKRTLFQRVVTHPGADIYATPGESAPILKRMIKPFTVFYVYERTSVNGAEWLKVGPSSNCNAIGWIEGTKASDWRQSLTLTFTERTGRHPVLFFKDLRSLEAVAGSKSPGQEAMALASKFSAVKSGETPPPDNFPILAVEPPGEAVSEQRFYIMPIFQTVERFEGVKFLQVASIDPGSWRLPEEESELRTAIVFVMDTTISMKPYIDRTRKAVRRIYDEVERAGLADKVGFGLVAFRNSTKKTPGVEYVSKVLSDIQDGRRRAEFEKALSETEEARVSTHSFSEDSFAGLKTALDELNWAGYQSRLIFLITDAGPIGNDDPYSSTGMNSLGMADMARAKGVKIFALHIKTPAGRAAGNLKYAETQYRALTGHSDALIGDLYVPIEADQPETGVHGFGRVVEAVAGQMVEMVRATSAGERLAQPVQTAGPAADVAIDAERKAAILGYAMQLEFLGRRGGVQAPKLVTSWVSDMDLVRPDTPSFQVAVMLTKNQLSDLYQRLKIILDQAQRTKRTGARDFFEGILSAAALTSRDPDRFRASPDQDLSHLGVLAEFLDDLPYRSSIMRLTEDDWYRLSVGEQQAIVDDLKSKLKRYQQIHDDVANWESFGKAEPGESVYRVPLAIMP